MKSFTHLLGPLPVVFLRQCSFASTNSQQGGKTTISKIIIHDQISLSIYRKTIRGIIFSIPIQIITGMTGERAFDFG
jgi:hypothetical protein